MNDSRHRLETCFWELTSRCASACLHCRVAGASEAPAELDGAALFAIAGELVALGVRRVVLTGGEPILRPEWLAIARHLGDGGATVRLFTSGHGIDAALLREAVRAGVRELAVSLDGPEDVHDALRPPRDGGARSSFGEAVTAIEHGLEVGLRVRVVTQVNGRNVRHLDDLYRRIVSLRPPVWQVQLCALAGAAAVNAGDLALEPADLERVARVLRVAARERALSAPLHCTVGYMTEEETLRSGWPGRRAAPWSGCPAGRRGVGITAGGLVKGCIALPDEFATADLRTRPLRAIWRDDRCFPYARAWTPSLLAGTCLGCSFGQVCRAGCPAVAYGMTGAVGANPLCLWAARRGGAPR